MNKLCKHICWKIFGFMVVCYYVDKMPTLLCGLVLLQTCKTGHHGGFGGEISPATPCILANGNVFIKIRLQICNQLSGSHHIIWGQTKPQGMGFLYITRQRKSELTNHLRAAGFPSADVIGLSALLTLTQSNIHTSCPWGELFHWQLHSLHKASFLATICFRTAQLSLTYWVYWVRFSSMCSTV